MADLKITQLSELITPDVDDVLAIVDLNDNTTKKITVDNLLSGVAVTLQTDGVDNGDQTLLNLVEGSNITLTDNGTGSVTITASGGGTPGGSNTQIQFNDSSAFGGDSAFTWDKTNHILSLGESGTPANITTPENTIDLEINLNVVSQEDGSGGLIRIRAGDSGQTNGDGGTLYLVAGDSNASNSGNGGDVSINAGDGDVGGLGGDIVVEAGQGGSTDGEGGSVDITSGIGVGAGSGGVLTLSAGQGGTSGYDGSISFGGTGTGAVSHRKLGAKITTNATPTSADSQEGVLTISGKSYSFFANVVARRTGGVGGTVGDSAAYLLHGLVKNISGTPTIVGQSILSSFEDQAAWDVALVLSSSTILVQFTGAANNTIEWDYELTWIYSP